MLAVEAMLIWVSLLVAAVLANNPTGIIEVGEYLAIVVSWVTVFKHLRKEAKTKRLERPAESSEPMTSSHPYRASLTVDRPEQTVLARWLVALRKTIEAPWAALGLTMLGTAAMVASTVVSPTAGSNLPALYLLPAAGAWTLVVLLHRSTDEGSTSSGPSTARPRARRVLGVTSVFVTSLCLGGTLLTSLSEPDSLWRVPGRLAAWAFAVRTAPLATDECLVYRMARYGGRSTWGITARASDAAHSELAVRGTSALPDIERGLLRAIDIGEAEQQDNLIALLKLTTRWPEADSIVRRWATATPAPVGQVLAKKWLVCIEKGRRNLIMGERTDRDCNPIVKRTSDSP